MSGELRPKTGKKWDPEALLEFIFQEGWGDMVQVILELGVGILILLRDEPGNHERIPSNSGIFFFLLKKWGEMKENGIMQGNGGKQSHFPVKTQITFPGGTG